MTPVAATSAIYSAIAKNHIRPRQRVKVVTPSVRKRKVVATIPGIDPEAKPKPIKRQALMDRLGWCIGTWSDGSAYRGYLLDRYGNVLAATAPDEQRRARNQIRARVWDLLREWDELP